MDSLVQRAHFLAVTAHQGQKDKIGEDYIHHPAAVVRLLATVPGFSDLPLEQRQEATVAAWLHDVLEDTTLTAADLRNEGFSDQAVAAIEALTHHRYEPLSEYYRRVAAHPLARLVKIADVAHNSSHDRMRWLDASTRARLTRKYREAADTLLEGPQERSWFMHSTANPSAPR